jgi:hypothetical protein
LPQSFLRRADHSATKEKGIEVLSGLLSIADEVIE